MRQYLQVLAPTNDFAVDRAEEIEPEGLFYSPMDVHASIDSWLTRWFIDVMVS
jgi:hypothetical protein